MSYQIHIKRPCGRAIEFREWLAVTVEREPIEWRVERELTRTNPTTGETMTLGSPEDAPYTIWTCHPDPQRAKGVTFWWSRGRVSVSGRALTSMFGSPSDPLLAKMHDLARGLGAQVVADGGDVLRPGLAGRVQAAGRLLKTAAVFTWIEVRSDRARRDPGPRQDDPQGGGPGSSEKR